MKMEITEDTPFVRSMACEVEPTTSINNQEEEDVLKSKRDSTVRTNDKHPFDHLLHCFDLGSGCW